MEDIPYLCRNVCRRLLSSNESTEDNTYLSYNKVIGTSLDEKLYLAFQILDYALLSAPGAPITKALLEAGIGKDISGSYDSSTYQPIFSIVAKNANEEQKAEFVKVIEDTLKAIVENLSLIHILKQTLLHATTRHTSTNTTWFRNL